MVYPEGVWEADKRPVFVDVGETPLDTSADAGHVHFKLQTINW